MNKIKKSLKDFYLLFTDAKAFYKGRHQKNYSTALSFYVGFMAVPVFLYFIYELVNFIVSDFGFTLTSLFLFSAVILMPLALITRPFFEALFVYMGGLIVGAEKGYKAAFNAVCYSAAVSSPYLILFILLNFLFLGFNYEPKGSVLWAIIFLFLIYWVHVLFTVVQGVKHYYGLSTGKSLVSALFLEIVLALLILISSILILGFYFGTLFLLGAF